jgi:protein O-GlcNAc transferase
VQVQSVYPNSTDNLLLMGAAYYHLGDYQQSVQCNDLCILLDPQIAEAHANLANSLQQLGHLPMAALYYQVRRSSCKRIVQCGATQLHTTEQLSERLGLRTQHADPLCVPQTALKLQPNFADACNNLASIFSQMGDVKGAVEYYSAALRINPHLVDVHQNLGDLWLSQGAAALPAAQRCFQEALLLRPKSARAWRGLGDASREVGEHSKAVELYKEVRAAPLVARAVHTGVCCSALGLLPSPLAAPAG